MRRTHALVQVALAMLDQPHERLWGYNLSKKARVRSGVLYPMLTRFLNEGWLTDGWEDLAEVRGKKRPPRRYYELTDTGRLALGALLAEARRDARFESLIARPA